LRIGSESDVIDSQSVAESRVINQYNGDLSVSV